MIKSIFKIFIGFIIIILLFITAFYFYGSSTSLSKDEYRRIDGLPDGYKGSDTLRIMTYNLGYMSGMSNNLPVETDESFFGTNQERLIDFLRSNNPDIIAFQEIDFKSSRSYFGDQLDSVTLKVPYRHSARTVNWDKRYVPFPYWPVSKHFGAILSGQAIASKYPVIENDRVVLDKRYDAPFYYNAFYLDRLIQISKLVVNDTELYILNVHLEAFDEFTREKQSLVVLEKFNELASDYPVILLGDFNAMIDSESDETISNIMKGDFISRAVNDSLYLQNKVTQYTYSSADPNRKIDYIFYNENKINRINASVLRDAGQISDHIPVMMSFSLR